MTAGLCLAVLALLLGSVYVRKQAQQDAMESLKRRAQRAKRMEGLDEAGPEITFPPDDTDDTAL